MKLFCRLLSILVLIALCQPDIHMVPTVKASGLCQAANGTGALNGQSTTDIEVANCGPGTGTNSVTPSNSVTFSNKNISCAVNTCVISGDGTIDSNGVLTVTSINGQAPLAQGNSTTVTADTTTLPGTVYFNALGYHGVDFASLGTGLVKNTTTTGVPTIATACTDYAGLGCANTFTGVATIDINGVGVTSADGVILTNNTAAALGAQQWSPRIRLTGFGWGTTGGTSQEQDWIIENETVQGATAGSNFILKAQAAGGGYATKLTIGSGTGASGSGIWNFGGVQVNASSIPPVGIYSNGTNQLAFGTNTLFAGVIDANQHWRIGGAGTPTIASGACGTGTNGTISSAGGGSNDQGGEIVIAAASTSTCTITFSLAYTTTAHAVHLEPANAAAATALAGAFISSLNTTSFTISGTLASTNWYYMVQ